MMNTMIFGNIAGVNKKISKLILGNENQRIYSKAIKLWDWWFENGGNTFDNSMYYSEGRLESFLGDWMKSRGLQKQIVSITKGGEQNTEPVHYSELIKKSLERLKLDCLDIFILHHYNPKVPSSEIIDALNKQVDKGLIKSFGVSNWEKNKFSDAMAWCKKNKKNTPSLLNNNFSLAQMIKPMWSDSISSNNTNFLKYLRQYKQPHFSWSSQARGFFIKEVFFKKILRRKFNKYLKNCFYSKENLERKRRAFQKSIEYNCSTNEIALSWVVNQKFPSFAIIGPKNIEQLKQSIKSVNIKLTNEEIGWLNLENNSL